MIRTGARSGSSQLVVQEVKTQTHHTASVSMVTCSTPSSVKCASSVGDLRDREDEHQVEEQFDLGYTIVLMRAAFPQKPSIVVGARHPPLCDGGSNYSGTPVCNASAWSTPPICPFRD